jgi:hypothetical protein
MHVPGCTTIGHVGFSWDETRMKTGTIAILAALLLTGGAFAVANKACKSSHHPWCVRSVCTPAGSEAIPDSLGATKL